jgi:hypothetical protein
MQERLPMPFDTLSGEQTLVMRNLLLNQVRFIVVGGYAVRHHGHLRTTSDLDLVIAQTPENIGRIRNALKADSSKAEWDHLLLPEKKVRWWDVEIFSTMRGLVYDEMESSAESCSLLDSSVRILSVHHLKTSKKLALEAADRDEAKHLQDKRDLEYLDGLM